MHLELFAFETADPENKFLNIIFKYLTTLQQHISTYFHKIVCLTLFFSGNV